MEIRKALVDDLVAIMKILRVVVPKMIEARNFQWDNSYPNESVFLNDISFGRLWVSIIDCKVVGFAAITTDQEPEYAEVGWDINEVAIVTHRLAVDPAFKGYGVGVSLLKKAEDVAIENGIKILRIDTNVANEATKKLFPKCGYTYCGEIGLSFRPGLRFYCYEKILN